MSGAPSYLEGLFGLTGRVALVTGASSGIGRRIALALGRAGASVVGVARREAALASLVGEIAETGGQAAAIGADLAGKSDFSPLVEHATEQFGTPTILVSAAGLNHRQAATDITSQSWDETLDLNLKIPFFLAKALAPKMIAAGGGAIINIASLQSTRAFENGLAYGASKGGVAQLTRAMAKEWSDKGVRANAIAPGFFPTELTAAVFENDTVIAHHAASTAMGRNGALPDLDGIAIFLASDASAYLTGAVIPVDGGYLAT